MTYESSVAEALPLEALNPSGISENRIIVLGGLGFIGHGIVERLLDRHNVTVIDNLSDYDTFDHNELNKLIEERRKLIKDAEIIISDVNRTQEIRLLIMDRNPTAIVHLASPPSAKIVSKNPTLAAQTMVGALTNIATMAKELDVHFTFFSSSMVYGEWAQEYMHEGLTPNPNSLYGILKYSGEMILRSMLKPKNLLIVRPSGVYGPMDVTDRVVSRMLMHAIKNEPIVVHGADTRIDLTYIKDLVPSVVRGINDKVVGTYNLSNGEGHTLLEIAQAIQKVTNSHSFISISKRDPLYPNRGSLSNDAAVAALRHFPRHSLEQGLTEYYQWLVGRQVFKVIPLRTDA